MPQNPNNNFISQRLTPSEINQALAPQFEQLHQQFPDLKIVLSISPVRHIKDGIIENQRSKSSLILASAELSQQFPFVYYYPAYEILIDELRDYRFYGRDLVHPNELAIDYIWHHFQEIFFAETTKQTLKQIQQINQALSHRPFHPESDQHQQFLNQQLIKVKQLQKKLPALSFDHEIRTLQSQII